jgi:hypothetical protein
LGNYPKESIQHLKHGENLKLRKLRESENVVKRVFGPMGKEETGGVVNIHDEKLHDLQSSSSIIMITEAEMKGWGGNLSLIGGEIYPCGFLAGNSVKKATWNIFAYNRV